jgi:hypothetical protein
MIVNHEGNNVNAALNYQVQLLQVYFRIDLINYGSQKRKKKVVTEKAWSEEKIKTLDEKKNLTVEEWSESDGRGLD